MISTELEYNGQALADKFVAHCTNFKENGYFLELGSREPRTTNNSYVLEKSLGWKGIMVDREDTYKEEYKSERPNSIAVIEDASKIDYYKLFKENNFPSELDFLQLDLEVRDNTALKTFMLLDEQIFDNYKFATITMEHDIYTGLKNAIKTRSISREILRERGYFCVFEDILDPPSVNRPVDPDNPKKQLDYPYEDWWVHPDLVDMGFIKRLQIKNEGKTQSVKVKLDFQVYSLDIFTNIDSFKVYEVSY